jgi:hypothetical protein
VHPFTSTPRADAPDLRVSLAPSRIEVKKAEKSGLNGQPKKPLVQKERARKPDLFVITDASAFADTKR